MHFFNDNNYDCYVLDWAYQGKSTRLDENQDMRHSKGFDQDISDLTHLINKHIPDHHSAPLLLLAHSMGGNLAMRYMIDNPDKVTAAALSTPMFGIKGMRILKPLIKKIAFLFNNITTSYVPGGHNWRKKRAPTLSHDPKRSSLQYLWSKTVPALRVGSPTFGWLYHALSSIDYIHQANKLKNIDIPMFIGVAQNETLVCNKSIIKLSKYLDKADIKSYDNAMHEILMERDEVRSDFLARSLSLFDQSVSGYSLS